MRILVAVVAFLGFFQSALAGKPPGTLSRCTQLLPEGKDYTVKIDASARNDGKRTTVKRTISVDGTSTVVLPDGKQLPADSKEAAEAFGREIDAFQKCLDENL